VSESVWSYPRPPRVEPSRRRVRVVFASITVADSVHALRVLETSHPPVYYVPPKDVLWDHLRRSERRTVCEFKGTADYYTLVSDGHVSENAAWSYPDPAAGYEGLAGHLAFYPARVDACLLDDEPVRPQPGDFYGGWVTSDIMGPFKGGPSTRGW
jgi:uncharacterized protein (DUF427 family)